MNSLKIIQNTGDLISRYLQVKKALSDNFSIQDAEIWLKRFKKQIAICNKLMSHGQLAISNARKLHTYLGHIKAFEKLLIVSHIGTGLNIAKSINNRVVWEELTSTILSRCGEFNILWRVHKKIADTDILDFKYFHSSNANIDVSTDLHKWFLEHVEDRIFNKLLEFQERDSGFALQSIISLEVNINKLEMGNNTSYIKLPE
nr:unnamed protein product [Callosobruchus chinensis]